MMLFIYLRKAFTARLKNGGIFKPGLKCFVIWALKKIESDTEQLKRSSDVIPIIPVKIIVPVSVQIGM